MSYYFLDYLNSVVTEKTEILGIDICDLDFDPSRFDRLGVDFKKLNLLEYPQIERAIMDFSPDRILHLASFSSVAKSWVAPIESFTNNTNIFLNLLEVVRRSGLTCRILSIGSSEEYGSVSEEDIPLVESQRLNPLSPYAVARVSQEMMSKVYVDSFKLDIVLTRSFNHIGPRQRDVFVIPSFVKQVCEAKTRGERSVVLHTGDVDVVRDFLDVRDVVKAYYALFESGKSGTLYNVCSGNGISLRNLIALLGGLLDMDIDVEVDKDKIRPNDNRKIIGSNERIFSDTGWRPIMRLDESLKDISKYWIEKINKERE